jgi:protein ImuB
MYWIALLPSHEEERTAWGWRALQFTPRVAQVDEALLLEVSGSERLWGGRKRLLRSLVQGCEPLSGAQWAHGATSLVALALLRLKLRGETPPAHLPQDLPLEALTAAREHVPTLERTGCRTWGDLRALPRAGVARRFGAALLDALDAGYGDRPERYDWLQLPEEFDMKFELAALATTAPELMWSAQRLLTQLQVWLQARHRGVLALELEWTLDLRRLNGVRLPSHEQLTVRTAQPTQDISHLRRLVSEHLSRSTLSAPANHLRLRSIETMPWGGADKSLLPEDNVKGERLHQLVERLSVRLGEGNVLVAQAHEDHRPEKMQKWVAARGTVIAGLTRNPSGRRADMDAGSSPA